MKNKKAGEEVSSPPDLDQEYELRTSAPQEERRKMDERDIEANKKNAISLMNMIKIK